MAITTSTSNLIDPSNEVTEKQRLYSDSIHWRHSYDAEWESYVTLYANGQASASSGCDDPVVNLVWSSINTAYSSLHPNNAKFTVNSENPEDVLNAIVLQEVINSDWRKRALHVPVLEAIKDSLIFGHGIVKVTFTNISAKKPNNFDFEDEDSRMKMVSALQSESRKGFGFVNTANRKTLLKSYADPRFDQAIVQEGVDVKRVSPFDFVVDHHAKSWRDCRWLAQRSMVPLEEVRKNKAWNRDARYEAEHSLNTSVITASNIMRPASFSDHDSGLVEIIEFYDLLSGEFCVFSLTGSKFLVAPTPTPGSFGHPYMILDNERIPEVLYPTGEIKQIASLQAELNAARGDRLNRRFNFRPRYLYKSGQFTDEALAALESDSPLPLMVPVDTDEPLSSLIRAVEPYDIPQSTFIDDAQIRNDVNETSGQSDLQRGVAAGITTATEASLVAQGDSSRVARKLANVESFLAGIGQKMAVLIQEYTSVPRALRITGVAGLDSEVMKNVGTVIGDALYFQAGRNSFSGPMDVDIAVGSVSPRNGAVKQKEASQLLALMAPFVGTVVDAKALLSHVLKLGFDIRTPELFFINAEAPTSPVGESSPISGPSTAQGSGAQATGPSRPLSGQAVVSGGPAAPSSGDNPLRNQQI